MKVLAKMLIVVGLVGATPSDAPTQEYDFWVERMVKLMSTLDLFARKYFGCPETGRFRAEGCRKAYGIVDNKLLKKARNEAKAFFDLEDRK
jgi:hypothetical protein